jgi:hypothetical protein
LIAVRELDAGRFEGGHYAKSRLFSRSCARRGASRSMGKFVEADYAEKPDLKREELGRAADKALAENP